MTGDRWLRAFALSLVMLCAILARPAAAQTCQGAIDTLNFGTIDLTQNVPYDTSGTVRVTCSGTAGATVRVCPNIGAGSGGAAGGGDPRYMINGGDQLAYNLFQDAGHATMWGSYTGPGSPLAIDVTLDAAGTGHASQPIYARVYSGQGGLPASTYSSTFSGAQSSMSYSYTSAGSCAAIGAANATPAPFSVTANDTNACTISASALNFGTLTDTSAPATANTNLSITCSSGTGYTIALNGGLTAASDPTQRKMMHGANQLTYGLYRDSGYSQPWGDTAGNLSSGTGDGNPHDIPVYGRIPVQTTPPPATYRDYVIATITY